MLKFVPVEVFKECDAGRRKSAGVGRNARPASHASKRALRADLRAGGAKSASAAYQVGPGRWARQPRTTLTRQHRARMVPMTNRVVKPTTGAAALKTIGMKKPV